MFNERPTKNNIDNINSIYSVSNKMKEENKEKHETNLSNDLSKTFNEIRN